MKATASRMNYETISFHILDAGYGSCAVMTFREIEPETNEKYTSPTDIYSSGTLGRLLCSVRRKILEVILFLNLIVLYFLHLSHSLTHSNSLFIYHSTTEYDK